MNTPRVHALIPAAGSGTRFGGSVLKQYLPINGNTVLAHSIKALRFHPLITDITVILAKDDQWFESATGLLSTLVETIQGGETRAQSVRNGLRFIMSRFPDTDWVLIHDAARPCLPAESLDRLLEQGLQSPDGAILAVPVADTLKCEGDEAEIATTLDRFKLWAAQTPQLFPLGRLAEAIDAAHAKGCELTDESSAMEILGARPKLIMGSVANIKITHPGDLAIAQAWLQCQH